MEPIDMFKKLRDVSGDVVNAMESENEKEIESALGRFMFICMQLDDVMKK
ncbi:hypothetical protein AB1L05_08995 [Cytobacillus horneckiae]